MPFTNSSFVNYTRLSPNRSNPRKDKIKKITIHHMAGDLSIETCGNIFASMKREASANYGIDSKGRVGMYVEEKDRSWCSSNANNDHQSVTIEVANDGGSPDWHVSDTALVKLIDLCVDICQRNGIVKLNYTGNTSGNLTRHNMFTNTTCPGPYLQSKFPHIEKEVNKRLTISTTPVKSVTDIAKEVITGKWGNGEERKKALTKAGYDYNIVQNQVNRLLGVTQSTPTKIYNAGVKITLKKASLYASATTSTRSAIKTGTFYLYDGKASNGRYRITIAKPYVNKTPMSNYVTGWVKKEEIIL